MSDSPGKKNPWAKLLAKQGAALPPADTSPAPPPAPGAAANPAPAPPAANIAAPPAVRPAKAPNPWAKLLARQSAPPPAAKVPAAMPPSTIPKPPAVAAKPPPAVPPSEANLPPAGRPGSRVWSAPSTAARLGDSRTESPAPRPARRKQVAGRHTQVSDEMAEALQKLAAEYAPLPVTSAPFVSARERALEAHAWRRRQRRWFLKRGAAALGVIALLYLISTFALFRLPDDEALAAEVAKTAEIVLPLYSMSDQPLQIDHAVAVLSDRFSSTTVRYYAEVTLRLRESLYGPALTNGTRSYRLLQESVQRAREQELNASLFPFSDGPKPPELPRLLQRLHRAGEPLVVRLPFEAKKFGWSWRFGPAQLAKRTASTSFDGAPLSQFEGAPYLVFGPPETMADVRDRIGAARDYVTTIMKEIQRRGLSADRADAESPGPPPPGSGNPAAIPDPRATVDPLAPAVMPDSVLPPGPRQPFDPDRPAVLPDKPVKPW